MNRRGLLKGLLGLALLPFLPKPAAKADDAFYSERHSVGHSDWTFCKAVDVESVKFDSNMQPIAEPAVELEKAAQCTMDANDGVYFLNERLYFFNGNSGTLLYSQVGDPNSWGVEHIKA